MAYYAHCEEWVLARIRGAKHRSCSTATLTKLPVDLYDREREPGPAELERRLVAMVKLGVLQCITGRWRERGAPPVAPSLAVPDMPARLVLENPVPVPKKAKVAK
jgi:hypothetical protein